MKRLLTVLLALILLTPAAPAGADNLNQLLGAAGADSIAAAGGALWLLSGDALWRWRPGEDQPALIAQGLPNALQGDGNPQALGHLLGYEQRLFSLDPARGALAELTVGEGVQLRDVRHYPTGLLLDADGQPRMIKNRMMDRDGVWLLAENLSRDGYDLLHLDEAGQVRAVKAPGIRSIAPYKPGSLLVIEQREGRKPALRQFFPKTGKADTLVKALPADADGLCYDGDTNTAYYFTNGEIVAHAGMGRGKAVACLPAVYLYQNPALVGGHLAASLPEGVCIRSLTQSAAGRPTVRVYDLDLFTLNKVRAMLPDIDIRASGDSDRMDAQALAQAVLSDTFPYDVAVLDIQNPQLYSLMDKGYLADLNAFPETARTAARMYPVFLEPVRRQQALYALPAHVAILACAYDPAALERIGLPAERLPRDILSLVDFLAGWKEHFGAFDGEILPAPGLNREGVINDLVGLYITQHQLRHIKLTFDTPLFRRMMNRIDGLDFQYLSSLRGMLPEERRDVPAAVLHPMTNIGDLARNRDSLWRDGRKTFPLGIGLSPDDDTVYPFRGTCAAVMARARDAAAAARVAAAISTADWGQTRAQLLFADYQPVLSDNARESLLSMQEAERSISAQLRKASGAEKTNLEKSLSELRQRIKEMEKDKYVVTPEEVDAYRRDTLPYLRPLPPPLHENAPFLNDLSFLRLFRQLVSGSLGAEQFIEQADRMLRMMEEESR